jgi:hypothetical protein
MREEDRYRIGATFHEMRMETFKEKAKSTSMKFPYGPVISSGDLEVTEHLRVVTTENRPRLFLGDNNENNVWDPVVVVWKSDSDFDPYTNNEGLYYTPQDLGLPSLGILDGQEMMTKTDIEKKLTKSSSTKDNKMFHIGERVPLEHIMWVLEPERLYEPITGKPYDSEENTRHERLNRASSVAPADLKKAKEERKNKVKNDHITNTEEFKRKHNFALFLVEEIKLLTEMCRGRSVNAISHLEKSFSYDLLLNMASNSWLPYRFRAAVIHFVICLYVDRFPQIPNCGTPHLPEQIWIFGNSKKLEFYSRKSTIPVVDTTLKLEDREALPEFYIPTLSSANGRKDKIVSMPSIDKFFLLSELCHSELKKNSTEIVYFPEKKK